MLQVSHGDKPECLSDVSDFPEVADNDMHSAEQMNAFLDETMQQRHSSRFYPGTSQRHSGAVFSSF